MLEGCYKLLEQAGFTFSGHTVCLLHRGLMDILAFTADSCPTESQRIPLMAEWNGTHCWVLGLGTRIRSRRSQAGVAI
jgi:hypothetical protein